MNEQTQKEFERWAQQIGLHLDKVSAMKTENPYADGGTWKAYEAWAAAKTFYWNKAIETDDGLGFDA